MNHAERLPEPEPLSDEQIIEGLKNVEEKSQVSDLVARFSPWVGKPEFAYDMLESMRRELKLRLDIDLFTEIRNAVRSAQEQAEQQTSRIKKIGATVISPIRNLFD